MFEQVTYNIMVDDLKEYYIVVYSRLRVLCNLFIILCEYYNVAEILQNP